MLKRTLLVLVLLTPISAYTQFGPGCTTAYYIDADCDGYGVGIKSSGVYPLGVIKTNITAGDRPDADDNDPSVNTPDSWRKKWGTDNHALVRFLRDRKGFTNSTRIFYVAQNGDNATGAPNDPGKPYRNLAKILNTTRDLKGGVIVVRGGTWTDLYLNACGGGINPCYGFTGTKDYPAYILAYPGERVETDSPWGNGGATYWPHRDYGYVTLDGFIFNNTRYGYGNNNAVDFTDSAFLTLRNNEFIGWHQLFFGNHTEDATIEQNVFHDNQFHAIYFGSSGMTSYGPRDFDFADDAARYAAGTSRGASYRGKVIGNVMYNNGDSGYEPIHINTYTRDVLVEGNIVTYSGGTGVNFQSGVYYSTIRNNVFFGNGRCGITLSLYGADNLAATERGNVIENNTIYVGRYTDKIRNTNPSCGIAINDYSKAPGHYIRDTVIRNNIIVTYNVGGHSGAQAFLFDRHSSPDTMIIENNILWSSKPGASPSDIVMRITDDAYSDERAKGDYNFAQFQAFNPNFRNNIYADPKLVNASLDYTLTPEKFDFNLQCSSPAINAGNPSNAPAIDIRNLKRTRIPDIGAYERNTCNR